MPIRRRCLLLSLPALLTACLPAAARAPELPGPIPAEVIEVVDGDTLSVRATIWLGQEVVTSVRLSGIDTPEKRARCERERGMAEQATALVRKLVGQGRVQLLDVRFDKYGNRVRARVLTARGTDLADALVKAGLARTYSGGRRAAWCEG